MLKGGSDLRLIPELVTNAKLALLRGFDKGVHGISPLKSSLGIKDRNQAASPGGKNLYPSTVLLESSIIHLLFHGSNFCDSTFDLGNWQACVREWERQK
jgi:hypothetical protein